MKNPDFAKLRKINKELEKLFADGRLTREEWDRLFAEADEATAGHGQFLQGTIMLGMHYGFVTDT